MNISSTQLRFAESFDFDRANSPTLSPESEFEAFPDDVGDLDISSGVGDDFDEVLEGVDAEVGLLVEERVELDELDAALDGSLRNSTASFESSSEIFTPDSVSHSSVNFLKF